MDVPGALSTSRLSTPIQAQMVAQQPQDAMECQWEECGKMFNNLAVMIEHIHNGASIPSSFIANMYLTFAQTISVCTNPTTPANGRLVPAVE